MCEIYSTWGKQHFKTKRMKHIRFQAVKSYSEMRMVFAYETIYLQYQSAYMRQFVNANSPNRYVFPHNFTGCTRI